MLFDETTTLQNRKQMDCLIRFWSKPNGQVLTKYLTSFFFAHAPGEKLVDFFCELVRNIDLPCEKMFNTSSDGPSINKKVHRLLNDELKKLGYKGVLPFIPCCLHVVHNAFHKGIAAMPYDIEQLPYNLHAWFKNAPCKEEDFRALADDTILEDESLFMRHISTRWLTLAPALKRIISRWDNAKQYFLTYLPSIIG